MTLTMAGSTHADPQCSRVSHAVMEDIPGPSLVIAAGSPVQRAIHVAVDSVVDRIQERRHWENASNSQDSRERLFFSLHVVPADDDRFSFV